MKKLDLGSAALVLSVAALVLAAVTLFTSPARTANGYTLNNPVDYAATCISLGGHPGQPYACYR